MCSRGAREGIHTRNAGVGFELAVYNFYAIRSYLIFKSYVYTSVSVWVRALGTVASEARRGAGFPRT